MHKLKRSYLGLCLIFLTTGVNLFSQSINALPTNGDVGIGTSNPSCKLEVVGETHLDGKVSVDSHMVVKRDLVLESGLQLNHFQDTANQSLRLVGLTPDGRLALANSAPIRLHALAIDSALKVGDSSLYFFGSSVSTPINHIFATGGPLVINGFTTTVTPQSTIINPTPAGAVGIGLPHTALTSGVKFTVAGISYFNGNIGIGTLPVTGARALIKASGGLQGLVVEHIHTAPYNYAIRTVVNQSETKAFGITLSDNDPLTFPDPENFVIMGNGCTNIGTGVPDIASQLKIESGRLYGLRINATTSTAGASALRIELNSGSVKALSVVNSGLSGGPGEVFRVTGDGKAWMHEIRVRLTPFPDYVFAPGYVLMDLDSLASYLVTEQHLPGFPTAQEIEQSEGADLGELVRLQQEHLEILTLQVIRLYQELKELECRRDDQ